MLDGVDRAHAAAYQPYWAVRAHLAAACADATAAATAYDRAIALTRDPAARLFLTRRKSKLT